MVLDAIVETAADLCRAEVAAVRLLKDGALHHAAASGQDVSAVLFGNFQFATMGGRVYDDTNGNGSPEPGEPGRSGFILDLDKDADGTVDQTTTSGANGTYSFSGLDFATYRVIQRGVTGWTQTSPNPADIPAPSGTTATTVNFGNFRLLPLSGLVFTDTNAAGRLPVDVYDEFCARQLCAARGDD